MTDVITDIMDLMFKVMSRRMISSDVNHAAVTHLEAEWINVINKQANAIVLMDVSYTHLTLQTIYSV